MEAVAIEGRNVFETFKAAKSRAEQEQILMTGTTVTYGCSPKKYI